MDAGDMEWIRVLEELTTPWGEPQMHPDMCGSVLEERSYLWKTEEVVGSVESAASWK